LRNFVGLTPSAASAIGAKLGILICGERERLNDVLVSAEVVECSVAIAEYFQVDGCVADVFAVGFDSGTGFGSFDEHIVSKCPMGSTFDTGRDRLTTGK